VKGGKETFPPFDPPILGAPDGQQSLPVFRTEITCLCRFAQRFVRRKVDLPTALCLGALKEVVWADRQVS